MEDASGRDLGQFRLWYEQAGTPVVSVSDEYDESRGVYRLTVRQSIPDTPGQTGKKPQHIPFALGLLGADGQPLPLQLSGESGEAPLERVLELSQAEQCFEFEGLSECPIPSLLRDFSAPVRVHYPWTREQLLFLMSHDPDGFNRWDAGQRLAVDVIQSLVGAPESAGVEPRLMDAYRSLLQDSELDQALMAKMLQLPSEAYLIELAEQADVAAIHQAREKVLGYLAEGLRDELMVCYRRNAGQGDYQLTPEAIARRSLRNTALGWLLHIGDQEALALAKEQFRGADNMTDRLGALRALVNSDFAEDRTQALEAFYKRFSDDPQVVELWFSVQASSDRAGQLPQIRQLLDHPAFDWKNPNKVRSVVGAFAAQNLAAFHNPDGSGYEFLAEQVCRLDDSNPQIAARLVAPLTRWRKFAPGYSKQMKSALERIRDKAELSRDVYEVVHKSLAD
jgi:aminopeptidase N